MKRKVLVVSLVVASLFGLCLPLAGVAAADTLTVVADDWCPYNCAPGSKTPGFGIEILKAIFEPQGIKVVYSNLSWAEALKETKAGKYGAVIGAGTTEVTGWVFSPQDPVGISTSNAFVKKGVTWQYKGPESLAGKRVGVIEGYTYDAGGKLDAWLEKNRGAVVVASGDDALEQLLRMLLLGKVDLIFEDVLVFNLVAREMGIADKLQVAGTSFELPIFVAFSPAKAESKRYSEMFSNGLRELRKNGKLAGILKVYGVGDWVK